MTNVDLISLKPLCKQCNLRMADGGGNKRLSVERIYQKKSQLEHILLRPDIYIGSMQVWLGSEGIEMSSFLLSFLLVESSVDIW